MDTRCKASSRGEWLNSSEVIASLVSKAHKRAARQAAQIRHVTDWALDITLVVTSVTVAAGMSRLFTDDSFRRDVLAMAFGSHLVAIAARRLGLNTAASALTSSVSLTLTATVLRYGATAWYVLPTGDTFRLIGDDLIRAWEILIAEAAPVEPSPGLVLVAGAVLWLSAFVSDTAAVRLRAPVAALAPSATIFVFTAVVGGGDSPIMHSAAYGAAGAAVLLAMRLRHHGQDAAWVDHSAGHGLGAMAALGVIGVSLAVAAGALLGPDLPGAEEPPWVDFGDLAATPTTRTVVNPLVQIRSRLVTLSEEEMFTVAVPQDSREYWRLMSLDIFDGNSWKIRSRFGDARDELTATVPPPVQGPRLEQTVTISSLGNIYLPAAYEVRKVLDNGGVDLEYEPSSGALVTVEGDLTTAATQTGNFTYRVESAGPVLGSAALLEGEVANPISADFLAHNTALPADFPSSVRSEAVKVTQDATSDYERAVLLQDYFWLGDRFTYDLNVNTGHGVTDLESFLFDVRAGYCEQFASAYAAMSRSLGLPTRVAVGFTWGEWDNERAVYVVSGKHAHAWPEVYFAEAGWVRFEPTPGRGAPDDFAVTGRVAAQTGEINRPEPVTALPAVTPDTFLEEPARQLGSETPPTTAAPPPGSGAEPDPENIQDTTQGSTWARNLGAIIAATFVAVGLFGLAVSGLRRLRRQRCLARVSDDPVGRIGLAWDDTLGALRLTGVEPKLSETPSELVRRISQPHRRSQQQISRHRATNATSGSGAKRLSATNWTGARAKHLARLADLATLGFYAPAAMISTEMARQAENAAQRIVDDCYGRMTPWRRLIMLFDPRPIFKRSSF